MACFFGHKWNGCKCSKCGKTRDEKHEWNGCKCSKCGKERDEQHDWNGCKCSRCSKTRNEQHDWKELKCWKCGKKRSIQEITDQAVLTNIAYNNKDYKTRLAAVEKLIDKGLAQAVYANIVENTKEVNDISYAGNDEYYGSVGYEPNNWEEILNKISDQILLVGIAKNAKLSKVYETAMKKLNDQATFIDIALNANDGYRRLAAVDYLTDKNLAQDVYCDVAKKQNQHGNINLNLIAVNELTNKTLLEDVSQNAYDWEVREKATSRLSE